MKRIIALMLALTLAISLAACGGDNARPSSSVTPPSSSTPEPAPLTGAGTISLDKSTYTTGETMRVTTEGITPEMNIAGAFVAPYNAGAAHDEFLEYRHPKEGADILEFAAPETAGAYEMRLYHRGGGVYTDETFVMGVPFTVAAPAPPAASSAPSASSAPEQPVNNTVTIVNNSGEDFILLGIHIQGGMYWGNDNPFPSVASDQNMPYFIANGSSKTFSVVSGSRVPGRFSGRFRGGEILSLPDASNIPAGSTITLTDTAGGYSVN